MQDKVPDFTSGSSSVLPPSSACLKFSPTDKQVARLLPNSHYMKNFPHERLRNNSERVSCGNWFNHNGKVETMNAVTRGPRVYQRNSNVDPLENDDLGFLVPRKDRYNLPDFKIEYENAKFFIIKSFDEDDVHKSIKYEVWTSTPFGNEKLIAAFHEARSLSEETGIKCPIFLFFSVNASGQFLGVAEIVGQFDYEKDMNFWTLNKYNGFFPLRWHIIKDVPNNQLKHIILEHNDNRPVTFSRDTQEVDLDHGMEMLKIFKSYMAETSLLDDFNFYETRENSLHSGRCSKKVTSRRNIRGNDNSQMCSTSTIEVPVSGNSQLCSSSQLYVRSNENYQTHSKLHLKVHDNGDPQKYSNSQPHIHGDGYSQEHSRTPLHENGNASSQMHASKVNGNGNSQMQSSSSSELNCNSSIPILSSPPLQIQNKNNSQMSYSSTKKSARQRTRTRSSETKKAQDAAYLLIGAKNRILSHDEVKNIALQRRAAKLAASNAET